MKLEKLSASSLKVAEGCLARFKAERDAPRGSSVGRDYNKLGSAVHETLENYIRGAIVEKNIKPTESVLEILWMQAYQNWFGNLDRRAVTYKDGWQILVSWYHRTVFGHFEVLSLEVKEFFELPTPDGPVKFNYIIDRLDKMGENQYRVVDYKTSRQSMSPDELYINIQAQIYALAIQIKYPDAEDIQVEFDMLRHSPVSVFYKKSDNAETWRRLKSAAIHIQQASEENPPETLNDECLFCIRKTICEAAKGNANAGGVLGYGSIEDIINARATLSAQMKAAKAGVEELDDKILRYLMENDITELATDSVNVKANIRSSRKIDSSRVRKILGPKLSGSWLTEAMTVARYEELLKSPDITSSQRRELEGAVNYIPGEPRIDTKFKTRFS